MQGEGYITAYIIIFRIIGGIDVKKNRITRGYLILVVLMFTAIFGFQYMYRLNIRKQPPSEKWGKEALISNGNIKSNIKLVEYDKEYIVAHNDGAKLKLVVVDNMGNKLNEKEFDGKGNIIQNISVLKDNKNIYLNWSFSKKGIRYLSLLKLDEDFNVVEEEVLENINESKQLSDELLLVSYEDKVEIIEIGTGKGIEISDLKTDLLASTKTDKGYLITYYNTDDSMFRYFYYKDGKNTEPKDIRKAFRSIGTDFKNISLSTDGKYGYIVMEVVTKGEFTGGRAIKFSLNSNDNEQINLEVGSSDYLVYMSSVDNARFIGTCLRNYGIKDSQKDIVDFVIKDGKVTEYNYVSRSHDLSIFAQSVKDAAVFADYNSTDNYNVYITFMSEEYKDSHNQIMESEKKKAFLDAFEGFIYSLAYVFIIGLRWIIPALLIMGVFSFFEFAFKERRKKKIFIGVAIISSILKLLSIKSVFYVSYYKLLPQFMSSLAVGLIISAVISFMTYYYSYIRFKQDTEVITIVRLAPALLIDSLFTLMIFTPFIPF